MNDLDEKAPSRLEPGTGQKETNCSNPIPAPAEAQAPFDHDAAFRAALRPPPPTPQEAAELAAIERERLKKYRRQEVADRLAEAQLELTLLEIEIRRAELAAMKEGGPTP